MGIDRLEPDPQPVVGSGIVVPSLAVSHGAIERKMAVQTADFSHRHSQSKRL
jgi:hypothetical protein